MSHADLHLLPLFKAMKHFSEIIEQETNALSKGHLKNLSKIVADKSLCAQKYAALTQDLLTIDHLNAISNEAKNALREQTTNLLSLLEENSKVLAEQQNSHENVIKIFQDAMDKETKAITYGKFGDQNSNKEKTLSLALNKEV